MSSLSYRDWDIWTNSRFFQSNEIFHGFFECTILASLMVPQTLEFLVQNYDIQVNNLTRRAHPLPPEIISNAIKSEDGNLFLKIGGTIDTSEDIHDKIIQIMRFLETISICVDLNITCLKLRFHTLSNEKILVANRVPIGRGVGFEIEERGIANAKLRDDLDFLFSNLNTNTSLSVGVRHYLTGMQLLALEDAVNGLIDAAYMQFYQGCEVLCLDPSGKLEGSKKHIATLNLPDTRELQIIAHQVWRVRHKYFGHGDVSHNLLANQDRNTAKPVASQVLVARYLCRRLLDAEVPSDTYFVREMGLYFGGDRERFEGQVDELSNQFRVTFDRRNSNVYDANQNVVEEYYIQ